MIAVFSGRSVASVDPSARFDPVMVMRPPGASGESGARLTALTAPPAAMTGVVALGCRLPPIDAMPLMGGATIWAVPVIVTGMAGTARGCQVPVQRPSRRLVRETAGSPDEKVATTEPEVIGEPQSSTTRSSRDVGQAAVVVKLDPSWVKMGSNLAGVQPVASRNPSCFKAAGPAGGVTTSRMATRRVELSSAMRMSSSPRYAPAARPVVAAWTAIRPGIAGVAVPVLGAANQLFP